MLICELIQKYTSPDRTVNHIEDFASSPGLLYGGSHLNLDANALGTS
jgi:hypothetical protein